MLESWLSSELFKLLPKLTKYIPHKPTPKQLAFLKLECLDAFFGGAAGGGKSDALLMAALQYVDIPKYNALLLRDTFANLIKPEGLLNRAHEWLSDTDAKWDGDMKGFVFPSGATVSFGYLDGPRDHFNYQGPAYQYIGIDEAVNIREHQAKFMFSRLRRLKGSEVPVRFRCASNPPTREQVERGSWVKARYVDPITREEGVIFVPSKMNDNPYLDDEEYRKSLKELDPITRRQLEEGDWNVRAKGEFFDRSWFELVDTAPQDAVKVRFWDRAATEESKENKKPAFTAGVKMSVKNGIYYIESISRFRKTSLGNEQTIRQIADTDGIAIPIGLEQEPGSAGKDVIDHYRRNVLSGFTLKAIPAKSRGSKTQWAAPWASQAEVGNVKIVKGHWNKDFLDEIELFPDGEFKDQVDGCSGAFQLLQKNFHFREADF